MIDLCLVQYFLFEHFVLTLFDSGVNSVFMIRRLPKSRSLLNALAGRIP